MVAIIPMRHNSERVPGKNYRLLAGKPLYHHILETLLSVSEIDEIVIDTDSDLIIEDAARAFPDVRILLRPVGLRAGEVPMNDVLLNTVGQVDADYIVQTHSTNPFLSSGTLRMAIRAFHTGLDDFDSVFGVTRLQARLWDQRTRPINHDPSVLLRTQDLAPVYVENSCFYIFGKSTFVATGNRIGPNPAMQEVPAIEAIDIDEEADFELALAIAGTRLAG